MVVVAVVVDIDLRAAMAVGVEVVAGADRAAGRVTENLMGNVPAGKIDQTGDDNEKSLHNDQHGKDQKRSWDIKTANLQLRIMDCPLGKI